MKKHAIKDRTPDKPEQNQEKPEEQDKFKNPLVLLFFAVFLLAGLFVFKDYGVTWDDPWQIILGRDTFAYISGTSKNMHDEIKYYGPAFEILLIFEEKLLGFDNNNLRPVFLARHLANFLFFYLGALIFYLLLNRYLVNNWKYALLGTVFLVISPRIFANSFYNTKDIPCLVMFIITVFTLIRYLDNRTFYNTILHSLSCAYFIDIRLIGLIITCLTLMFLFAESAIKKDNVSKTLKYLFLYIFCLIIFITLFWPFLWDAPFVKFIQAYKEMMHRPLHGTVLYMGKYIEPALYLPWHYIPFWILITTPVLYTLLFFTGCIDILKSFLISPVKFYLSRRNEIIFALWFFVPVAAGILFKTVFYNAWRHLFFIYPAFIGISVIGFKYLINSAKLIPQRPLQKSIMIILALIVTCSLLNTAWFMIKYHPFQNVYFNALAGRDIKNNFELDYWGLSYKQALEYILKTDRSGSIKINVEDCPGFNNSYILDNLDKKRLIYVDKPEDAKYFLTNYIRQNKEYPYKNEYYSIKVNGLKIMTVFNLEGGS